MKKHRVVITGIGSLTPLGNTTQESWQAAKEGKSGIDKITRFDVAEFSAQIAGEVKNFEVSKFIDPKEIKKLDIFSQYAVAASQEAWDDSGVVSAGYDMTRFGCILGVGIGGISTLEKYHQAYLEGGPRKISPFLIPAMISNLAPGNIAIRYGLKGVNFTITSACTSATHALGESYKLIASGAVDAMISGGAESAITPTGIGGFCALRALSTRNSDPQKASRPFDKDRDGFVMGEGAVLLVLENLERAQARGAKIYAEISGYGSSCDAFHMTAPCDDGAGAVACMKGAIEDSGLRPEQIQYVNAHGTSTAANDSSETAAIKQVFGSWAKEGLLVSSTKSMTGHLLGAAGAVEAAFCALALRDQIVPPTINLENPGDGCGLDYVAHKARAAKLESVISNSFGFGGTNASIVLSKVS